MRRLKRIVVVLGIFFIVLGLIASSGFLYITRKPFPQINGTIHTPGLQSDVNIIRDKWGVPHVYADTTHDLFFAQGYVTAQDRLWQMEFWRHTGAGRLSEMFGADLLREDLFIRAIGWRRAAEADYDLLSQEDQDCLQWYADGVNAFITTHYDSLPLEFTLMEVAGVKIIPEPWTPIDTLTWDKVIAWDLRVGGNSEDDLFRADLLTQYGQERGMQIINTLWPPYPSDRPVIVPDDVAWHNFNQGDITEVNKLRSLLQMNRDYVGSNNWVIDGMHTTTGKPILANDMHLGIQMPSIWYDIGLHCRTVNTTCPFNVTGHVFPGVPGVVIGHNDRIAWGATNLRPDVQDIYIEHVNPENPNQFEFQGKWEEAQIVQETVRFTGKDLPEDFEPTDNIKIRYDATTNTTYVTLNVRITRHGPVLNDVVRILRNNPDALTLKWTALQPGTNVVSALFALNRAQNWDDMREALRHWKISAQSFVFADVEGNIAYQASGLIPIRAKGDGFLPVPGWTGEYEWIGYIPFEDLPSRLNPEEGFIVTANNAVVNNDYPFLISRDWDYGYRAQRITDLLRAKDKLSIDDIEAIQGDTYVAFADQLMPYLQTLKANTLVQKAALEALVSWDHLAKRDRVGASIFEALVYHLVEDTFEDELGPTLADDYIWVGSAQRAAINALLDKPRNIMWDNISTTKQIENRDVILQQAFEKACEELESRLGSDVTRWNWGRLHTTLFRNGSLGQSGIPIIEAIFNRGPFATDGTDIAVNSTPSSSESEDRYAVVFGSSDRYIADLSDWSHSLSIHTTGQSGHPYHKHYDDFIDMWRNIQYRPMLWLRTDIETNKEGILTLQP